MRDRRTYEIALHGLEHLLAGLSQIALMSGFVVLGALGHFFYTTAQDVQPPQIHTGLGITFTATILTGMAASATHIVLRAGRIRRQDIRRHHAHLDRLRQRRAPDYVRKPRLTRTTY